MARQIVLERHLYGGVTLAILPMSLHTSPQRERNTMSKHGAPDCPGTPPIWWCYIGYFANVSTYIPSKGT
jgi:hypothetical protein